jgi:hypothetical protein
MSSFGDEVIDYNSSYSEDDNGYTTTTNGAIAFKSSGDVLVDFFMMYVRDLKDNVINDYMRKCWNTDPTLTIALVFNGRDRAEGKKEKKISNHCMIWLRNNVFNTYKQNILTYIEKFGCWKDLWAIDFYIKRYEKDYELVLVKDKLIEDLENLKNDKPISLCAKWVPSEGKRNDKKEYQSKRLATIMYGDDNKKNEKLRKEYLVPLRNKINIVETKMCQNQWTDINYSAVPAQASTRYRKAFIKHDQEGYEKFLNEVKSGEKEIKVNGILPHELVSKYISGFNNISTEIDETIELQWKTIVNKLSTGGKLNNSIAVVDLSGSMFSALNGDIPARVASSLGIITSLCCSGPFHKKIITFSENPNIVSLKGDNLFEHLKDISNAQYGLSTNFIGVADLILNIAKLNDIKQEDMPEKIITFTDMQFNCADRRNGDIESTYKIIKEKFISNGYKPPKFIFWNLNADNKNFPLEYDEEGTALVSGFSEQLLKIFMEHSEFNPKYIVYEILQKYIPYVEINEGDI